MDSKGGGGGFDTSGLEKATKESIALQKQIYDQTRQDVQPWYNLGTGAVNRLGVLLGVGTGGAQQTKDQLYNSLKPKYTNTQQVQSGGLWVGPDGRVYNGGADMFTSYNASTGATQAGGLNTLHNLRMYQNNEYEALKAAGWSPLSTQGSVVDQAGLDSAVNRAYSDSEAAAAAARNDPQYGSLLKSFGLEDYQADPGYQFRQQEAQKALERQMASQGVTLGGGGAGQINPQAFRAMNELTQNLASQEYGNAYQRYTADNLNKFNMLMGAAGMGQGSTGILAGAGQNYAGTAGQLTTDLASAQMNAQLAKSSQPSMFGSLLGAGVQIGSMFL